MSALVTVSCAHCGVGFECPAAPRRVYCSETCVRRAEWARIRATPTGRVCVTTDCGREAYPHKTTCIRCYRRILRVRRVEAEMAGGRLCGGCGERLPMGRSRYCSDACGERERIARLQRQRRAGGAGIAPEGPAAWGVTVEEFLARNRPRDTSGLDPWARREDAMESAAGGDP